MYKIKRETTETSIELCLDLKQDYKKNSIDTPVPFINHMLEQISIHSNLYLLIKAKGDVEVDAHHTVEDIALCFGEALEKAIQNNHSRYGYFCLPMEEALASVVIDLRNSSHFEYRVPENFLGNIGNFNCELVKEFFRALSLKSKMNLHIILHYGDNKHHMAEAIFKCFAKSLKMAIKPNDNEVLSSKGSL